MIKYKITLSIGIANAAQEDELTVDEMGYTDKEWQDLTETQKEESLQGYIDDWASNYIDVGWEEIKT